MKPLEQYPTTEADEIIEGYLEMGDTGQFRYGPLDLMRKIRDLERRLAACREALQGLGNLHLCGRAYEEIENALTLTAPKP